ncbi:MAG: hypothetical protein COS92_09215 [Desulfobacterales bacterium CG07_land_8_20_14_0_80_52_14]|nr:MAG: hypothetical protein COX20_04100 [Desulfobacterales bacterium CG23_combo_of_CG06-09_8_20_14_all_52_9]PIU48964.1 MAG: hypothetical protein COS92_09215 [Desulfobacterales bacterium CG07_land_8_20_14_0_80_52_14]
MAKHNSILHLIRLQKSHFLSDPSIELYSLEKLTPAVRNSPCYAAILDLDSLPLDNHFIRNLFKDNSDLCVIGTSS